MLIRFCIENFLSFNDQVEFSMVPGRGRTFPTHKIKGGKKKGIPILRAAAIYGANASGKSNLIKGMAFAKNLIVKGVEKKEPIPIKHFKLDTKCREKPSKFQFDFKYKEKFYSYGFAANQDHIHEEYLYEIDKVSEKKIFERKIIKKGKKAEVKVTFGKIEWKGSKDEQFLKFVAKGTRPNQLFLTESIERNVPYFQNPYNWFDNILTFIFPESIVRGIEIYFQNKQDIGKVFKEILRTFDTGISNVITKKYKLEEEITEIPDNIIASIKKELKKKNAMIVLSSSDNKRYSIYKDKNGDLIALKMMSQHKIKGSEEKIGFEINEESDGTQRIIDLLPALTGLLSHNKVFVIDELDRSLHPHLTKGIMKLFLDTDSKRMNQLIVTTHESSLLDFKLLRKDEIWFIEKNKDGESKVYSLEEFQPRYDKDIRKGYLLGRFGAIPFLKNIKDLNWSK